MAAYLHKILIRRTAANICLPVLKHADKQHIVVIRVKVRLNILEISDHNRDIVRITVAVCIHHAALFGQVDTGDAACPFRQRSCNRPAPCANLEHLVRLFERNPVNDIGTQRGKMVKNRPAFFLLDNLRKAFCRIVPCNIEHLILDVAVRINILSRIVR